ncbi:hypothetical protein TNIN_161411 [Trichonephila inaurata madagascariensis]|uniref:Uncharacterized protein n=1 Tax=Trichonephila inaurata madagascariensis TaxID=2747483 RepID=A0A8X6X5Q3_9ARAC|nr:hypothetical protein TNIN_161411 [Trichonephila inaurata madagascariensis]
MAIGIAQAIATNMSEGGAVGADKWENVIYYPITSSPSHFQMSQGAIIKHIRWCSTAQHSVFTSVREEWCCVPGTLATTTGIPFPS